MKSYFTIIIFLYCTYVFGQEAEKLFCEPDTGSSYFTFLDRKKIQWENTNYIEEYSGTIVFHEQTYYKFKQMWANGNVDYLYLREDDGRVLQYETCCDTETVRYDEFFEPGAKWVSQKKNLTYTLLSYNDSLKTPLCNYTGLMSIKAEYTNGSYYIFYYQQGSGYIGAKDANNRLVSYIMPL